MTPIADTPTFVAHLECAYTGERFPADTIHGLSPAGKPMLVQYDLDGASSSVTRDDIASRPDGMWRYREFLPVRRSENVVTLNETQTPLVSLDRFAARLGARSVVIKDEGRLPTGSFKAFTTAIVGSLIGVIICLCMSVGFISSGRSIVNPFCPYKRSIFIPCLHSNGIPSNCR